MDLGLKPVAGVDDIMVDILSEFEQGLFNSISCYSAASWEELKQAVADMFNFCAIRKVLLL